MNEAYPSCSRENARETSVCALPGQAVTRTPVGDEARRIPRSQQCANRQHATRLLRRDTFRAEIVATGSLREFSSEYARRSVTLVTSTSSLPPNFNKADFEQNKTNKRQKTERTNDSCHGLATGCPFVPS